MSDEKKEVIEEVKEKKIKIKYINQKCGLKISKELEFNTNDIKSVDEKTGTMLLTDFYQQFEGADSAAKKIHESVVTNVKKVQVANAKKKK